MTKPGNRPGATSGSDKPHYAEQDDVHVRPAREVNRELRAERAAAKAKEKKKAKVPLVGLWKRQFAEAGEGVRKGNPKAQLTYLLKNGHMPAMTGSDPHRVSEATSTAFSEAVHLFLNQVRGELGMNLQDLSELSRRHVMKAVLFWKSESLAASTVANRVSHLRKFFTLIGKPDVIPRFEEWKRLLKQCGVDPSTLRRSGIAEVSKSWNSSGIDPMELIAKVRATDPLVAMQMETQLFLGLRVKESMRLRPEVADHGTRIWVEDGTKGGLSRWVEFSKDPEVAAAQRDVLDRAKEVAKAHKQGRLAIPGLSLKKMRRRYYYVCAKHGITKKGLDVVSHGLRHGWIHQKFKEQSGLPAFVERTAPVQQYHDNYAQIQKAAKATSFETGHLRPRSTWKYIGSMSMLTRQADAAAREISDAFVTNAEVDWLLKQSGAITSWLVGKVAEGIRMSDREPVEVVVLHEAGSGQPDIDAELGALVGRKVVVTYTDQKMYRPDPGVELVFTSDRSPAAPGSVFRMPRGPRAA